MGKKLEESNTNRCQASQVVLVVKNLPANAGDTRDTSSIPGSGRSPGIGNGTPLQYSCLENSMGKGVMQATVHEATKGQTRLSTILQMSGEEMTSGVETS